MTKKIPALSIISIYLTIVGAVFFLKINNFSKIEVLATLPPENPDTQYNVLFDPYSRIAVYSIDKHYAATSSSVVVVNGKMGKTYDASDQLVMSTDGKRLAFVAKQNNKEFVVVDGVEGKKYDYVKNLKFSPDGRHIAYAVGEEKYFQPLSQFDGEEMVKTMFVVVDTSEGRRYDGTSADFAVWQTYDPFFSRDGKKITYTAIKNGKEIIVVDDNNFSEKNIKNEIEIDDKDLSVYAKQRYPQFIGSSYDLVYLVSDDNKSYLVVAGQKGTIHDYIDEAYHIGKDASQIAYEATDDDISTLRANGFSYPISPYGLQAVSFSSSGDYVAYYTRSNMGQVLFVNGKLFGEIHFDRTQITSSPLFSPNEKVLVYSQYSRNGQYGSVQILSVNPLKKIAEVPLPKFNTIGLMKFSSDGKYIYFKGLQDRKIVFVTLNVDQLIKGKKDTQ